MAIETVTIEKERENPSGERPGGSVIWTMLVVALASR
jgi:hypothetical protein